MMSDSTVVPTRGSPKPRRPRDESIAAIQVVERVARVLGLFSSARPRLTLSELGALAGMSKPTMHRYALALRTVSLLRYDRATATYTLGPLILRLATAARAGISIVDFSAPYLEQLSRDVNETVVLSVWDGEAPVVVRVEDNLDRVVRVSISVGTRLSPLDSAQGRVFCAYLDRNEVPVLRDRYPPGVAQALESVRQTGISVNTNATFGVTTVAAPVFGSDEVIAALAIVGTSTTVPSDPDGPLSERLRAVAGELSAAAGSHVEARHVVQLKQVAVGEGSKLSGSDGRIARHHQR